MAGVKGMTGGGARNSAGRPKGKAILITVPNSNDRLSFLVSVMNNKSADSRLRINTAKALVPFVEGNSKAALVWTAYLGVSLN